ncbi:MAG: DUF362 domain-containing protein [Proteobacteria bacterium]|nr:DUF362 domain-containing protein [Pseudomonadota bacterium]
MTKQDNVYIRRCENYDRDKIRSIVEDGMNALNYNPFGNIFVKPNVVFSSRKGKYGKTAYTEPSLVGASLLALSNHPNVFRVDMGEKTAIGYPTRLTFKNAGYYNEMNHIRESSRAPVNLFCIDEEPRERVFVGGKIHDTLRIARKMAQADSMVYLPKLKCHCVSTMTGAVKLNIGICSDDERAIRHDFLLNDKIVDLLAVGSPNFIVMDAIDVGVGNEAFPTPRKLGLVIMGTNPLAVDLVGARLLGYNLDDVPYLKRAVKRGYLPAAIEDVNIEGDLTSVADLDIAAKRILPYDEEFVRWQGINKELTRMASPIRFYWGYTNRETKAKCETGCIMGAKMFFGFLERFAGVEAFKNAKPAVMVIGHVDEPIDAAGQEAFLIGSCSHAHITNAKKVVKIDNCFTTAVDMAQIIRGRLGIPSPITDPAEVLPLVMNALTASFKKTVNLRYAQDIGYFIRKGLQKRI